MKRADWTLYHSLATVFVLVVFVFAGLIAEKVFEQVPHLEDEVAYLFQAQVFAIGRAYVDAPFHTNCFFAPFVLDYQGHRFGKYPPGWPALLSVGLRMGQGWWVNAACAAVIVALVFRLAREIHSPLTGAVAAGLGSTSPFLLLLSGSFMSHTSCLAFVTAFTWCYWRTCPHAFARDNRRRGPQDRSQPSEAWSLAAGLMLGCAFVIRPYTAIAVALPAGIHALWRLARCAEWKRVWFIALGCVPLTVIVPLFNAIWTGDPFLSPYVLFWPYDRPGFGPGHGVLESGNTVWLGLSSVAASIGLLATHLHGWPAMSLTFVVLLFMFRPRRFGDLFLVSSALSLIMAYTLYWTSGSVFGPRYAHEITSALLVLSAGGITHVGRWARHRGPRWQWALSIGLIVLVGVSLFIYLPGQCREYHGLYGITASSREILEEAGLRDALVIVDRGRGWWDYAVAFSMNEPTLTGDVVYASECSPLTDELLARYPDRTVYRFDGRHVLPYGGKDGGAP